MNSKTLNEQQHEFVNHIKSATLNMTELVQNMMSLAQMDLNVQKNIQKWICKSCLKKWQMNLRRKP